MKLGSHCKPGPELVAELGVEAVVEQHDLRVAALLPVHQHVAGVRVAVHVALVKYHPAHGGVTISAANRLIGEVVLGPSPG